MIKSFVLIWNIIVIIVKEDPPETYNTILTFTILILNIIFNLKYNIKFI